MTDNRVFRVTVRGQFIDLSAATRSYLVGVQTEHDIFVSAYTEEGTFTYDERIMFFNMRYEIRAETDDKACKASINEAEAFLRTMGFAHKPLKANAVDTSEVWTANGEIK